MLSNEKDRKSDRTPVVTVVAERPIVAEDRAGPQSKLVGRTE